jgi:hypothetical protein
VICKEGEEKRRKEEENKWLAEIHLNFENNSKTGPSSGDDLLGCDLQVVEIILPSFQNF